jgi:chromosome segregation ATPase
MAKYLLILLTVFSLASCSQKVDYTDLRIKSLVAPDEYRQLYNSMSKKDQKEYVEKVGAVSNADFIESIDADGDVFINYNEYISKYDTATAEELDAISDRMNEIEKLKMSIESRKAQKEGMDALRGQQKINAAVNVLKSQYRRFYRNNDKAYRAVENKLKEIADGKSSFEEKTAALDAMQTDWERVQEEYKIAEQKRLEESRRRQAEAKKLSEQKKQELAKHGKIALELVLYENRKRSYFTILEDGYGYLNADTDNLISPKQYVRVASMYGPSQQIQINGILYEYDVIGGLNPIY